MADAPLTLAVYTLELPCYACARLRLLDPARALGGRVRLRPGARTDGVHYALSADALAGADVVFLQRYFPMAETWPLVEAALACGAAVVYDLDDDLTDVPQGHPMAESLDRVRPFVLRLLERADLVTVSTPELARALAPKSRAVAVLPNLADPALWRAAPRAQNAPAHVVFAGTPSHQPELAALAPVLARLQAAYGPALRLTLMGCDAPGLAADRLPFEPDYAAYARTLAALAPDIGLAPLADTPFNRRKSAVKWLEFSALGAAGVYADLPPYAPVEHGRTGLKAGQDPAEWGQALARLLDDPVLRLALGRRARAEVFGRHRLETGAEAFFAAWSRAVRDKAERTGPGRRSGVASGIGSHSPEDTP